MVSTDPIPSEKFNTVTTRQTLHDGPEDSHELIVLVPAQDLRDLSLALRDLVRAIEGNVHHHDLQVRGRPGFCSQREIDVQKTRDGEDGGLGEATA